MTDKLLTVHHLAFLSLRGDCTALSESTYVKMPHYWKSHATAHLFRPYQEVQWRRPHSHHSRTFLNLQTLSTIYQCQSEAFRAPLCA